MFTLATWSLFSSLSAPGRLPFSEHFNKRFNPRPELAFREIPGVDAIHFQVQHRNAPRVTRRHRFYFHRIAPPDTFSQAATGAIIINLLQPCPPAFRPPASYIATNAIQLSGEFVKTGYTLFDLLIIKFGASPSFSFSARIPSWEAKNLNAGSSEVTGRSTSIIFSWGRADRDCHAETALPGQACRPSVKPGTAQILPPRSAPAAYTRRYTLSSVLCSYSFSPIPPVHY